MKYHVLRYSDDKPLFKGDYDETRHWFYTNNQHIKVFGASNPAVAILRGTTILWIGKITEFKHTHLGWLNPKEK